MIHHTFKVYDRCLNGSDFEIEFRLCLRMEMVLVVSFTNICMNS